MAQQESECLLIICTRKCSAPYFKYFYRTKEGRGEGREGGRKAGKEGGREEKEPKSNQAFHLTEILIENRIDENAKQPKM